MMAQTDPFAAVRLSKNPRKEINEISSNSQIPEQANQDPFAGVRINNSDTFSGIREVGRHATRIGSRVAETLGGIPGDVSSLIQSGVLKGLEKLTGIPSQPNIYNELKNQRLPTSNELKQLSEKYSSGYTKAQAPTEQSIDEFVETAASLFGPMKFRKALGIGLGSQLAKEGVKAGGFGEGAQEGSKLGTMFLLSAMNPGGAMRYASSQYDKANQLSRGASISAHNFQNNLQNLVNDLEKGVSNASKSAVIKPAKELIDKVKNGKILVQDLTAAKRDLNTIMKDPAVLTREKKLLKVVGKEVDNAIKPYEKMNPAFAKAYRPANEIYGAVMQGTKAADFIKKTLGTKSVLGATLAEAALGQPEMILPTLSSFAGAHTAARGYDFFSRVKKSPELRKLYGKAMLSAAKEDVGALRKYEKEIEEMLNRKD